MRTILFLLLCTAQAFAQQPTPEAQALSNRLLQEIGISVQCSANLITLQAELAELKKKLKERGDAK